MRRIPLALAAVLLAGTSFSVPHAQAQTPPAPAATPAPAAPAQSGASNAAAGSLSTAPVLAPVSEEAHKQAAALTEMIGVNRQSTQLIGIMRGQMIQLVIRVPATRRRTMRPRSSMRC